MFANTTVTVYRDTVVDVYGDETDVNVYPQPGLERVVAALTERSRTFLDAETGQVRVIRVATLRVTAGTGIKFGDQVRDAHTGKRWRVTNGPVETPSAIGSRALSFDLEGT